VAIGADKCSDNCTGQCADQLPVAEQVSVDANSRLVRELLSGEVEMLSGLHIALVGEPSTGLDRASLECLLRRHGARIDKTICDATQLVAIGVSGDASSRYRDPEILYLVLARRFPEVKVVDADLLLRALVGVR